MCTRDPCPNLAPDLLQHLGAQILEIDSTVDSAMMASTTGSALMVVAVALLVMFVSRRLFKRQRLNLPPGPRALPIIGCLHLSLGAQPHRDFADLARKHGPVMSLPLGQWFCVVATSPEAAKEFLKLQDANFSYRPPVRSAEIIFTKDLIFHDITPMNRHLKKILVSELTSMKRVEASKYIRTEEAACMLGAIAKEMGQPIEVRTFVNIMSTNILSRMIFNKRFHGSEDQSATSEVYEFMAIIEEMAFCMGAIHLQDTFNFIPDWFDPQGLDTRFRKLRARMDVFSRNVIEQHKEDRRKHPVSEGQKTLLDVLLDQLEHPELGVTKEHVLGILWDGLGAGTSTTTLTSEWAMAEILRNPAVGKKARLELDQVVGLKRAMDESDIPQLKYIQAIIKETLRLHAIPLLTHQSMSATKAFGYDIPAKTKLFVNVWAIGRDPSIWEKPLDFIPERFLEGGSHEMVEAQGKHFELLPFGAGRRQCPGIVFGLTAVQLQLGSLLQAFDWSLLDGMTPDMLDMTDGLGLTPPMRIPLVAVAKPRLPSHLYQ